MRYALSFSTALAAAALAAAPAGAETYSLLIYESPAELRLRSDDGAAGRQYWASYAAFGQTLTEAGALRGGAALAVPTTITGITLSGYFTLETATRAEAERLAASAPATRRGGRVELRAHLPMMAPPR